MSLLLHYTPWNSAHYVPVTICPLYMQEDKPVGDLTHFSLNRTEQNMRALYTAFLREKKLVMRATENNFQNRSKDSEYFATSIYI